MRGLSWLSPKAQVQPAKFPHLNLYWELLRQPPSPLEALWSLLKLFAQQVYPVLVGAGVEWEKGIREHQRFLRPLLSQWPGVLCLQGRKPQESIVLTVL